jgi:hypothetical protein
VWTTGFGPGGNGTARFDGISRTVLAGITTAFAGSGDGTFLRTGIEGTKTGRGRSRIGGRATERVRAGFLFSAGDVGQYRRTYSLSFGPTIGRGTSLRMDTRETIMMISTTTLIASDKYRRRRWAAVVSKRRKRGMVFKVFSIAAALSAITSALILYPFDSRAIVRTRLGPASAGSGRTRKPVPAAEHRFMIGGPTVPHDPGLFGF